MSRDDVDIRIRLREAAKFNRDARKSASEIDNIGDQAAQAARRLGALSVASTKTRVNLGPLSTSMRGGVLAVGALAYGTQQLAPAVISAAEAVATLTGGAGAAGGVGLLALAQASTATKLGLGGLMDALGGNQDAAKNLTPELFDLFTTLDDARRGLADTAGKGLIPGLDKGAHSALRNLHVFKALVGDTAETVGGLGKDAGAMLGSKAWGRDITTVGKANVDIIDNLGHAGLNLADATRHIVVEAAPLAKWLSRMALDGSDTAKTWAENARTSGDMAHFFREARRDLALLGSATGHGAHGLINLFGAQDVDGTKTLENLDQLMARFETWTTSPAVRHGVGQAIVDEIPDAVSQAVDILATSLAHAGPHAAKIFLDAFMGADAWGKLLMGAWLTKKLGGFKLIGKAIGGSMGTSAAAAAAVAGKASPVPVIVMNPGFGGGAAGAPGKRGGVRPKPGVSTVAGRKATKDWVRGAPKTGRGGRAGAIAALLAAGGLTAADGGLDLGGISDMIMPLSPSGSSGGIDPNRLFVVGGPGDPNVGARPITNPFHPDPFGNRPLQIKVVLADGTVIAKTTQRANAHKKARQGGG